MRRRTSGLVAWASTLAVIVCVAIASSCASLHKPKGDASLVYLTNEAVFQPLPTDCLVGVVDSLQRIEGAYGDSTFSFTVYIRADASGLAMSVLNEFGTELAFLAYGPEGIETSGMLSKFGLRGEYILADFQIAYYDPEALESSLRSLGLEFSVTRSDDVEIREIRSRGALVAHVEKRPGRLLYENALRGYRYEILELTP